MTDILPQIAVFVICFAISYVGATVLIMKNFDRINRWLDK
jgi:hypothetical protein